MQSAVIGLGETGYPLYLILKKKYTDIIGIDERINPSSNVPAQDLDIINICIPYSDKFIDIVKGYQNKFRPKLTVIHSTVPIGTTRKIENAVHSPILGKHDNMMSDIETFKKWVGGDNAIFAAEYFGKAWIWTKCVPTPEETEALKLMCLATYGISIAFAQYKKELCDKYGFSYLDVLEWDRHYNLGVDSKLKRPLVIPPGKSIGGHCVVQNTKILNEQHPNQMLEEILKYA